MSNRSVVCEFCSNSGLVAVSIECSKGRCAHGSKVEFCYEACVLCDEGKQFIPMIAGLREPRRTPEQNRAIVAQYRADRKLAGVSSFSVTKLDASRAA